MKSEEFLRLLNNIDEKYIENAAEKLENYRQIQAKGIVYVKQERKFAWREVLTSVICTSAVIFGVFSVVLNLSENTHKPNSSGVSIGASSENSNPPIRDKYGLNLNTSFSGEISVNAAYSFENDIIKRYKVGDKFGENAEITNAKSTFLAVEGNPVLLKQELTIAVNYMLAYSTAITENCLNELDLPSFGSGFKTNPLFSRHTDKNDDNSDSDYLILLTTIGIDVDYSDKTITPYTHNTGIIEGGH